MNKPDTPKSTTAPNSRKKSVSGIDSIAPMAMSAEKGWISILKAFNPLGTAAQLYGDTLAYRVECKRIDAELKRVQSQFDVVSSAIDKEFQLNMEALTQRRLALNRYFDTVQGELQQHHIERMTVLKMAERANEHFITSTDMDAEARRNCKELIMELTAQIPLLGDRANTSLQTLVMALPQVNIPQGLLPKHE